MSSAAPSETDSDADARRRHRWWVLPLAIAALAVFGFVSVRNVQHRGFIARQQQQLDRLQRHLDEARQRGKAAKAELEEKQSAAESMRRSLAAAQAALEVLRSPDLRLLHLSEAGRTPGSAHVLMSKETGRAVVYAFGLPPPDRDHAYHLWWITESGQAVKAGLFRTRPGEPVRIDAALPDEGAPRAAAVTIEPARGVKRPTGPTILSGDIEPAPDNLSSYPFP